METPGVARAHRGVGKVRLPVSTPFAFAAASKLAVGCCKLSEASDYEAQLQGIVIAESKGIRWGPSSFKDLILM